MSRSRNLNKKIKRDHQLLVGYAIAMHNEKGKEAELKQEAQKIMERVKKINILYPGSWQYRLNKHLKKDLTTALQNEMESQDSTGGEDALHTM
jgi:hypothetical protein